MFIVFLARNAGETFQFLRSLVENARFGSVDSHFLRKSRGKCSFWKASFSVSAKVSWNCSFWKFGVLTFCCNFMENVYFGGLGFTGSLTVGASRSTSTTKTRTPTAATTTTTRPPLKMFMLPIIIHHLWHLHRPCTKLGCGREEMGKCWQTWGSSIVQGIVRVSFGVSSRNMIFSRPIVGPIVKVV